MLSKHFHDGLIPHVIFILFYEAFFLAVLRIRIHRIHMLLGLPDPYPDPFVRGMDPDLSINMKNSKKNLDSFYFVTLFDFLS